MASRPPSRVNGACTTTRSSGSRPCAATAARMPAVRSATVVRRSGPAAIARRRWPRPSTCSVRVAAAASLSGSTASLGRWCRPMTTTRPRPPRTPRARARRRPPSRARRTRSRRRGSPHAVRAHEADLRDLGAGLALGVADLHAPAVLGRDAHDAARDLGEVGVADLVDQQARDRRRAARERAGVRVGDVAHLRGDVAHVLGEDLRDAVAAGQRARRGRERHARPLGDVHQPQRAPALRGPTLSTHLCSARPCVARSATRGPSPT